MLTYMLLHLRKKVWCVEALRIPHFTLVHLFHNKHRKDSITDNHGPEAIQLSQSGCWEYARHWTLLLLQIRCVAASWACVFLAGFLNQWGGCNLVQCDLIWFLPGDKLCSFMLSGSKGNKAWQWVSLPNSCLSMADSDCRGTRLQRDTGWSRADLGPQIAHIIVCFRAHLLGSLKHQHYCSVSIGGEGRAPRLTKTESLELPNIKGCQS